MSEKVIGASFQGAYPERTIIREGKLDKFGRQLASPFQRASRVFRTRNGGFVRSTASFGPWASLLTTKQIREEAAELGQRLRLRGFEDELIAKCFALTREAATRTL